MHIRTVPSFFFTKSIGAPQGDTLGWIYPFSMNSCNYSLSSTKFGALMQKGDFEAKIDPIVSSMENSRSHFGGNPGISLGNMSLNYTRTQNSLMCCSLSSSMPWMFTTNSFHPFLLHFFSCKADIILTETFLGMP